MYIFSKHLLYVCVCVCVCVYVYIINIHSTHTYIMQTKTFILDVINRD